MKKVLTIFSQFAVGALFVFSGLVKMNDPVGFSFKLEEYFSEEVLNLTVFEPFALSIAGTVSHRRGALGCRTNFGIVQTLDANLAFDNDWVLYVPTVLVCLFQSGDRLRVFR
jgi:hypothetical protein